MFYNIKKIYYKKVYIYCIKEILKIDDFEKSQIKKDL